MMIVPKIPVQWASNVWTKSMATSVLKLAEHWMQRLYKFVAMHCLFGFLFFFSVFSEMAMLLVQYTELASIMNFILETLCNLQSIENLMRDIAICECFKLCKQNDYFVVYHWVFHVPANSCCKSITCEPIGGPEFKMSVWLTTVICFLLVGKLAEYTVKHMSLLPVESTSVVPAQTQFIIFYGDENSSWYTGGSLFVKKSSLGLCLIFHHHIFLQSMHQMVMAVYSHCVP